MGTVNLYRLRLQPRAATLSPWQADTLFGHLCWEVYFQRGETGLAEFLAPFREGHPPFVISDGFPGDSFPPPLRPPRPYEGGSKFAREQAVEQGKAEKALSRLSQAQFERALRGDPVLVESEPSIEVVHARSRVLKNQINRLTGTTGAADEDAETGNLYGVEEHGYYEREHDRRVAASLSIYLWAEDRAAAAQVEEWFRLLARGGYGKKKSVGYGRFAVVDCEPIALTTPDDANGFVALAGFVPAAHDPTEGFFKTYVKYGKLGEAAILNGAALSPFKYPLVMLTSGSTFYCDSPIPPFAGRLVYPIHRENDTIVQGGFAPVVPLRLPDRGA